MRKLLLTMTALSLGVGIAAGAGLGRGILPSIAAATAAATAGASQPADYYAQATEDFFKRSELDTRIGEKSFNLPLLEAAVFHQTNRQRVSNKLTPFKYGQAMDLMARRHSQEMSDLQYFEHTSPVPANATLGDRLKNAGLVNVTAGENIAVLPAKEMGSGNYITHPGQGDDVWFDEVTGKKIDYYTYRELASDVVTQWMNSPAHHANIVDKRYVYLGVGVARGPYEDKKQDSFYFTQNFCATITPAGENKAATQLSPK